MCRSEEGDSKVSHAENLKEILERQQSRNKVETVRGLTYLGDSVTAGGGCEAAVTARTRCGFVKLREWGELLYGRFPLKPKGAVYKRYVRPAIMYGSEAWCLKESKREIFTMDTMRALRGVQLKMEIYIRI